MYHILIVDDESRIRSIIRKYAEFEGHTVTEAGDGMEAVVLCRKNTFDLIIMDIMMPELDGFSACREIRKITQTPIIMLSARGEDYDKINGFELGIDDYVVKPFGVSELLARIRTALRHTRTTSEIDEIGLSDTYHVGGLEIDYKKMRVCLDSRDVHLTPNEFKIVALLGKHAGRVMTYKAMLRELWGPSVSMDNKILRVHMASIRRKIEPDPNEPRYIFTEVGVGYRMAENEEISKDIESMEE